MNHIAHHKHPSNSSHFRVSDQQYLHFDYYQKFLKSTINLAEVHNKTLAADEYLRMNLQIIKTKSCDLPDDPAELGSWMDRHIEETGRLYHSYLDTRKNGQPRRFFPTKAHALLFIQRIAPTKKVDGAWLYGMLRHWNDSRLHPIIHTYLDEIGNGASAQNHVLIFEKLLREEGISSDFPLPDHYYQQGAIQLALGYSSPNNLPEVIGFNFGYEVLPLHLLISTYELRELGIDPFYFSLHLTIDNPACGHARQALNTIESLLPQDEVERAEFYKRLKDGYLLNNLGITSTEIIKTIELEKSVIEILQKKAKYSQYVHSDYCQHDGKSVNEWLSNENEIPAFIETLKNKGWININQDPTLSRFWHLIHGDQALMFGVFTSSEQQIIYDWIAGEWQTQTKPKNNLFKSKIPSEITSVSTHNRPSDELKSKKLNSLLGHTDLKDTEHFLPCWLRQEFEANTHADTFNLLIPYLSNPLHTHPLGLLACRKFIRLLLKNSY